DHHGARGAEQVTEPIGLPDRLDAGLRGHVLDIDAQDAHAEPERPLRDLAARATEADDAHRQVVELELPEPDRLAQGVVGLADRRVQAAREGQQERERVLGEMDADAALLAGQRHVALDQLLVEDRVHARADRLVIAQPLAEREDVRRHAAEERVGVDDLAALGGGVLRLDEGGARAGGVEDGGALLGRDGRHDHQRRVEDLHRQLRFFDRMLAIARWCSSDAKHPARAVFISRRNVSKSRSKADVLKRLLAVTLTGGSARNFSTISSSALAKSADATARFTRPMRSPSRAVMGSPNKISSFARPRPINRGSRYSAIEGIRHSLTAGRLSNASSTASR